MRDADAKQLNDDMFPLVPRRELGFPEPELDLKTEEDSVIPEGLRAGRERRKNTWRRRGSFRCPWEVAGMGHDLDSLWSLRKESV